MFCNSSTIYFYPKLISLIICCCSWSACLLLPGNKHHRYPRWLGKMSSVICTLSSAISCQHRFISKNASKNINPGLYVTPFIITLWFYNSSVFCITEQFLKSILCTIQLDHQSLNEAYLQIVRRQRFSRCNMLLYLNKK